MMAIVRGLLLAVALACPAVLAGTPALAAGHRKPARHAAHTHKHGHTHKRHRKAPPRSAKGRPSITRRDGAPFVPVPGDWEGTLSGGHPMSLQLAYERSLAKRYGGSPYGFEDMSILLPEVDPSLPGCPETGSAAEVIDADLLEPLAAGGMFRFSSMQMSGGLTGARSAELSIKQTYPAGAGFPASCDRTLSGALHPAQRHRVDDGTWTLSFTHMGSETFQVKGGGRLATGVAFATLPSGCGGGGDLDLFIDPDGAAADSEAGQYTASLTFTTPSTATGQISLGTGSGCTAAVSAVLTKPAP